MIRGDVCYFSYPEPDKRRPVVVLTRTDAIEFLHDVTVAPITTAIRDNETSVWLDEADGVREPSSINLDRLLTIPKHRLGRPIAQLSLEKMDEIREAIMFSLGYQD